MKKNLLALLLGFVVLMSFWQGQSFAQDGLSEGGDSEQADLQNVTADSMSVPASLVEGPSIDTEQMDSSQSSEQPEPSETLEMPALSEQLAPPALESREKILLSKTPTTPEEQITSQAEFVAPKLDLSRFPSLFFLVWEHDLISDARQGLNTRPPDTGTGREESEAAQAEAVAKGLADAIPLIDSPREIALGGIVYGSAEKWTIWINGMRVSPDRIPAEIMDLKVYKDYIELEWFDPKTNQVFPVRMKSHQRFNLDARIFLPGQ
jgi:hypothetical protein